MQSKINLQTAKILFQNASGIEIFGLYSDSSEALIEESQELARFDEFFTESESFRLWGYAVRHNEIFGKWMVSSEETGTSDHASLDLAVEHADRGTLEEHKQPKTTL